MGCTVIVHLFPWSDQENCSTSHFHSYCCQTCIVTTLTINGPKYLRVDQVKDVEDST